MGPKPKLGLIAGGGRVPLLVREACRDSDRAVFIAALNGFCDPETVAGTEAGIGHGWFDMTQVGKLFDGLKAAGVAEVTVCGSVTRPDFSKLLPDWRGAKLLPRFIKAGLQGDDAVLRVVVETFEAEGFRLVGVDEIVAGLLAPEGQLGAVQPGEDDWGDIHAGIAAARALGAEDKGQAVVAALGEAVGFEDQSGTDALLRRMMAEPKARGGVLVKCLKPGQERRVDLPTIGTDTVANAQRAGLRGIAVEAGAALIVDRRATVAAADAAGLYLIGFRDG
ncbi:LpxI family protein [Ferrovibrio sp.]|uniref:LpxI family protein n=1 Tax=Ferrovibrio sp. TaxID=1917215 RepID=UPI003D0D731B